MITAGEEFRDDGRQLRGLAPADVKRLSAIDAGKATLAVVETWAVIALAAAAAIAWWHPIVVVIAILVIGSRQHALFALAHDAAHYRLYRTRWLNDLVGGLCGAAGGISMRTYRVIHRLHHNHLYGREDPDVALAGGCPRGRAYLLRKLATDLAGLTAHKTYAYFFGHPALNDARGEAIKPLDDTSPRLRQHARRDRVLVIALQAGLFVAAIATGWWLEYLLLWIVPAVTVLQALLRLRAVLEHGAVRNFDSALTAARTNTASAVLLWWLFPHHVNYHIEHHLYPAIPHYNLAEAHALLRRSGALADAEVSPVGQSLVRVLGT
ncbi:MAG: fatty acid desaturase family protein [Alphaproteobacteria bacterium]|jgi:fatty acid desaturase|nr:fatty acid desaturase family protein [Alphaproteobacteria bacterium]